MKTKIIGTLFTIFAILAVVLSGCAAPNPSNTPGTTSSTPVTSKTTPVSSTTPGTSATQPTAQLLSGKIEVRVTDAPPKEEVVSVNVTVSSVEIHKASANETDESGWLPMQLSGATTFDLLKIKGLEEVLATGNLTAGNYTQIRMEVTKVEVTLKGGKPEAATLPSGKLKFVQPFEVAAGKTTVLLFDFDAAKSVNIAGNGKVMFKPVIKLTVTKTPGQMEITTKNIQDGEIGVAYNDTLHAIGGTKPYTWSIASGALNTGLTLGASGNITGTPTASGNFTFSVKVEDSSAVKKSATGSFTMNISAAGTLKIVTSHLPDGDKNADYSVTLHAVGGTSPYSWTLTAGTLPAGLALNVTTGVISGTPTATGDSTITVKVTDSASPNHTDTRNFTIHIDNELSPGGTV